MLQLERCLDGDLSRNEAAPGCISERRELAPLRVAVPVFHGTPHAFPQPSRPHSDVCCPAGVSWHHERRRKRSPPSLHPPFTRSPFSFTRPHPNHPVHPVSLPFTLSRVYIIHAVHQHPLPHRFAIARHANTIEPQTLKSSPNPTMAIPPPMTPSKVQMDALGRSIVSPYPLHEHVPFTPPSYSVSVFESECRAPSHVPSSSAE